MLISLRLLSHKYLFTLSTTPTTITTNIFIYFFIISVCSLLLLHFFKNLFLYFHPSICFLTARLPLDSPLSHPVFSSNYTKIGSPIHHLRQIGEPIFINSNFQFPLTKACCRHHLACANHLLVISKYYQSLDHLVNNCV